jgi:hypothetical protein
MERREGQLKRSRPGQGFRPGLVGLLGASALYLASPSAQAVGTPEPASYGKGIFGGGLLLAELTLTVESALHVEPWWAYALGGGLGAVGGGIGGYFLATATGPELPTAMMVSSLVFVVPTTILVLAETVRRPPVDAAPQMGAALARPVIAAEAPLPRVRSVVAWQPGLGAQLSVPAFRVGIEPPKPVTLHSFASASFASAPLHATNQTEFSVHVPLLDLSFR